jgi:hypothetical protein
MNETAKQPQELISSHSVTKPLGLMLALASLVFAVGVTPALASHGHNGHSSKPQPRTVLKSGAFGSQPTGPVLFGVAPGGAPWVIHKSDVRVRRDGLVDARLTGLVIPTPPSNGTNPVPEIAGTVYCNGAAVGTTKAVPFSNAGDARIFTTLGTPLPSPCLAPAVLFNPAAGGVVTTTNYIAATGA